MEAPSDTIALVEHRSLLDYLDNFLDRGREYAYVQPRGYRWERWTYRQVAETAFQFARELESRGVGKGDRVLIWGPNRAEWVAAFFGCALRGAIVVPIDDIAAADFARRVSQQVSAKLMVCSREHLLPSFSSMILDELSPSLARHSSEQYSPAEIDLKDTLEIVFTSGTTAEPKGVVISHANVLGNIAPLAF